MLDGDRQGTESAVTGEQAVAGEAVVDGAGGGEGGGAVVMRGESVQQRAVEMLASGKSILEAAEALGVHRTTVHRWLADNTAFKAKFEEAQKQLRVESEVRLTAMVEMATDAVKRALAAGDARMAMQLLKGLGILQGWKKREAAKETGAGGFSLAELMAFKG
jgi:hypothetical protein